MNPVDTVELLANLDFVIEKLYEERGRPRKAEVLQKLQARLRKRRTIKQIDNKLRSLNGSANPKSIEDVYRYGSSRIKNLDIGLKLKAQAELESIKSEEVCKVVSTPRQLRSASRNPTTETSRFKRESTTFGEHTPTRTTRSTQYRESQFQVSKSNKNKPLLNKDPLNQDTITVQNPKFLSRLATTPPSTSIADTEERIKSSQSSDTCREGSFDGTPNLQNTTQSFFYATELQATPTIEYDDLDTVQQFPEKLAPGSSHETLRDLFNDNLYFRQKWLDSEEKREKAVRNERLRHSLLAPGSADILQTMADTIENQNDKINAFQRQLSNQTFLQPFLTLGRGEEVLLSQAEIQVWHAKMRRDFRSLSIINCFQHPGKTSACLESQDLDELKSNVFDDVGGNSIGLVIQSLTGAAVCKWVFNEKIQCTAMMDTPLLKGYRHHLRTICSELALRNLDLAAHQWVVNEEQHFRDKFLPRTATRLSERLLNALSPFINKGKSKVKLQIRLDSIFSAALNIKFLGMISKNVFEFIWPAHNSIFETISMVEESPEGTTYDQTPSKQEEKKVMLALVPGLRIYNCDRNLVDYCGFTTGSEEGLAQSSLVAQAVVVTQ